MKRLRRLAVALTVVVTVIALAPVAMVASAQTIRQTRTAQQDPCAGAPAQSICEAVNAIGKVWAELEKSTQPQTAAQEYFLSFANVKDCAPSFITGELGWAITFSQWKLILGEVLKLLTGRQIQTFWDNYQEIRNFPLTPHGGCLPPAWVIKDNHPGLWKALSSVWLVPVFGGGIILPIFSLPNGSKGPAPSLPAAPTSLTVHANPSNGTVLLLTCPLTGQSRETCRSATRRVVRGCLPGGDGGGTPVRHEHGGMLAAA
jgi:hypothetical protein